MIEILIELFNSLDMVPKVLLLSLPILIILSFFKNFN
jgi:hypothetical protein